MLLLKLAGEVAVRPLVWLPDAASVRRKMVFAPIPDIFIESLAGSFHNNQARCERVGPVGEGERATARALYGTLAGLMQRRINLNEEHLGRYMRSATDPAVADWHAEPLSRERLIAILSRMADDFGDEVGQGAGRAFAALQLSE